MVCRPAPIPYQTGWTQGFTLMSDLHIGASNVDYALIKRELAEAVESGDRILLNGDVFDAIVAHDKRFTPDVLHKRLRGRRDVLNGALDWAVELLSPAAGLVDVIGIGNHEETVSKYSGIDMNKLLVHELQKKAPDGHKVHFGGYTGFVDYRFAKPVMGGGENRSRRFVLYYHHGAGGGGAPVTRGMLDLSRKGSWVNADVIWLGHKHYRTTGAVETISCPNQGDRILSREVRHVMTGSYFVTYQGQSQDSYARVGRRSNYAADAGLAPQGRGGARVELKFTSNHTVECPGYRLSVIQ